jgi:hypothetical protein
MRRVIDRCVGIDVNQALLVVCVRLANGRGSCRSRCGRSGVTTPDLLVLRDWCAPSETPSAAPFTGRSFPARTRASSLQDLRRPVFVDGSLGAWAAFVTQPERVTSTVEQFTGPTARSFRQWATDNTAVFR